MAFNPMAFITPEQQAVLQEIQKFTKFIHVTIRRNGNSLDVSLTTDNPQAEKYLPQIQQAMIGSVAQALYTLFNISGKVI